MLRKALLGPWHHICSCQKSRFRATFKAFAEVKKLRQSAGLSDQQVAKVRAKFSHKLEAGKRVEPQEFECLGLAS